MSILASPSSLETITLGGGCFWCIEAVYLRVQGVTAVESGYCNGQAVRPTYEQVCGGRTGHAEVVRVTFDPQAITLREILEIFFVVHDPTTLNRQRRPRQEADRHRDRAARELQPRRGLPPALFREQPRAGLLRIRRRAEGREIPQDVRGAGEGHGVAFPSRCAR